MAKLGPGVAVTIVLQNPREKFWGLMRELDLTGAHVRGIDLNAFDELIHAIRNSEPFYAVSETVFPMWRIERITADDTLDDILSMSAQFKQRTGFDISEIF